MVKTEDVSGAKTGHGQEGQHEMLQWTDSYFRKSFGMGGEACGCVSVGS